MLECDGELAQRRVQEQVHRRTEELPSFDHFGIGDRQASGAVGRAAQALGERVGFPIKGRRRVWG